MTRREETVDERKAALLRVAMVRRSEAEHNRVQQELNEQGGSPPCSPGELDLSLAEDNLVNLFDAWGLEDAVKALRTFEERALYLGAEPPSNEEITDLWHLRDVIRLVERMEKAERRTFAHVKDKKEVRRWEQERIQADYELEQLIEDQDEPHQLVDGFRRIERRVLLAGDDPLPKEEAPAALFFRELIDRIELRDRARDQVVVKKGRKRPMKLVVLEPSEN